MRRISGLTCLMIIFFVGLISIGGVSAGPGEQSLSVKQDIDLLRVKTKEVSRLEQEFKEKPDSGVRIKQVHQEINQIREKLISSGEMVVPEIIKSLKTVSKNDKFFAETLVSVLQGIGEPAVPAVIDALKKAKSTYEKKYLIDFFGERYAGKIDKNILQVIEKFLNDKKASIRLAAVEAVSKAGEDAVVVLGERLLKEDNDNVKELILDKLETINSKLALPYLDKMLDSPALRVEVVRIISRISGESSEVIFSRLSSQKRISPQELKKCKEDLTRSYLGILRSALSIYYAEHDGVYPEKDLEQALIPKYLPKIPEANLGIDGFPVSNKITYGKVPDNTGGWLYNNDKNDPNSGYIMVNCSEKDTTGVVWSSY